MAEAVTSDEYRATLLDRELAQHTPGCAPFWSPRAPGALQRQMGGPGSPGGSEVPGLDPAVVQPAVAPLLARVPLPGPRKAGGAATVGAVGVTLVAHRWPATQQGARALHCWAEARPRADNAAPCSANGRTPVGILAYSSRASAKPTIPSLSPVSTSAPPVVEEHQTGRVRFILPPWVRFAPSMTGRHVVPHKGIRAGSALLMVRCASLICPPPDRPHLHTLANDCRVPA
jgi:hypothetical protein